MSDEKRHHHLWQREDDLINHRLTWLLASQGLLFAAYGWLQDKPNPAKVTEWIPSLGIASTIIILCGILGAMLAQFWLWYKHRDPDMYVSWPCVIIGWVTAAGLCGVFLFGWWAAK